MLHLGATGIEGMGNIYIYIYICEVIVIRTDQKVQIFMLMIVNVGKNRSPDSDGFRIYKDL
jgi:hypothetical protein